MNRAHLLESTQAQLASRSISFPRLLFILKNAPWKLARKASAAAGLVSSAVQAQRALQRLSPETRLPVSRDADIAQRHAWFEVAGLLDGVAAKLNHVLEASNDGSVSKSPVILAKEFAYLNQCAEALKMLREGGRGFLSLSPARGSVTLTIASPAVRRFLAARWAVSPCSMLLSSTFFFPGSSRSAVASGLGVSNFRAAEIGALRPSWRTSIPVLHQPSQDEFRRFMPPPAKNLNQQSLANWVGEISHEVARIASGAKGGTLVLMAGHQRLDAVSTAIKLHHQDLGGRLISQSPSLSVSSCVTRFRALGAEGKRPILIATGTAWSAIDLSDWEVPNERAHEDMLLTDLVIPALPFGMEHGIAHRVNKGAMGFGAEVTATLRKTRVGIARLMRRDGVKDRHIWLLDGRLVDPAAANYTAGIRLWLAAYIKREHLIQMK